MSLAWQGLVIFLQQNTCNNNKNHLNSPQKNPKSTPPKQTKIIPQKPNSLCKCPLYHLRKITLCYSLHLGSAPFHSSPRLNTYSTSKTRNLVKSTTTTTTTRQHKIIFLSIFQINFLVQMKVR